MTLAEQREHEDGLNELALRAAIRDMVERLGEQALTQILQDELNRIGR